MISISRPGRISRKILTIAAAVFAAALMIAVPVLSAVDTDADFTKDEAGYSIKLDNPSDEQMAKVGLNKFYTITSALWEDADIFNDAVVEVTKQKADTYSYTIAEGQKVLSDEKLDQLAYKLDAGGFEMVLTAKANGLVFNEDALFMSAKLKAAVKALNEYFGEVKTGDTISIVGDVKDEYAMVSSSEYLLLDDGKCVYSKVVTSGYYVQNIGLEIEHGRDHFVQKKVRYDSDFKGVTAGEANIKYDESPVKVGTTYTVTYSTSMTYSGDTYFTIDGNKYSLVPEPHQEPEEKGTVTELKEQSSVGISSDLKPKIDSLPASEDGMTIEKTYSSAESVVDGVMMDAVGKDILKIILIVVAAAVITLLVIIVLVVILVKRKKKRQ